jgi:HNH endonuclease
MIYMNIPLGRNELGDFAVVDDNMGSLLAHKWYKNSYGYAVRTVYSPTKKTIFMHHLIIGRKNNLEVDHINRNKLDNRKENLRLVSHTENEWNKSPKSTNTSGAVGVSYFKPRRTWRARVGVYGQEICLGYFKNKSEAIDAVVRFKLQFSE